MYGLALCLPGVGQPQGLPVPRETLKNPLSYNRRGREQFPLLQQEGEGAVPSPTTGGGGSSSLSYNRRGREQFPLLQQEGEGAVPSPWGEG